MRDEGDIWAAVNAVERLQLLKREAEQARALAQREGLPPALRSAAAARLGSLAEEALALARAAVGVADRRPGEAECLAAAFAAAFLYDAISTAAADASAAPARG